jgi:predicted ArsR family transcriptional regulator
MMKSSAWQERLFESTRGRVLALLQTKNRTVNKLAHELQLTDNAVRAHLVSLERDGLVRRAGTERGVRRPHLTYAITEEAEHVFPKAYGVLLSHFVAIVAKRLEPRALRASMREVGRRIAADQSPKLKGQSKTQRIKSALVLLKEMGGAATLSEGEGRHFIRGHGCPLAAITTNHQGGCLIAEALLSEIIGVPVKERCIHGATPSCRFEIP